MGMTEGGTVFVRRETDPSDRPLDTTEVIGYI
jgi:hypothetical protein